MLLTHLHIRNFRGIEDLSLPLDDLCVLIGENNSGKSSILDALRICLTRSLSRRAAVFDEYDYHLEDESAEPSKAKPIEITLRFAESKVDEWPDEVSQILAEAEQVDAGGLRSVTLRVTSKFDVATNDYVTEHDFLDLSGKSLIKAKNFRRLINLQQLVPTFYLASLRDAAREFSTRSPFWRPFVRSLELDEQAQGELEAVLGALNETILKNHTAFETVKERLKNTARLMPMGERDTVSIEAVPSKVFDILSRTQVHLASKTGAKIPIVRHGSGTQSLAVICLFDAFLQSQLEKGYGEHAEPLLAMEEPEAHLHPSAIKAAGQMLQELSGQKLISTHSGDLLASISLEKIRRIRRRDGRITVHMVKNGTLTKDEINKLDYQIRIKRGGLLFSRCWLLVEGETEAPLLSECARAMGYDFHADGVSCVEFSQVGVEKFIKLADQLGIEWFLLADNDSEGRKYRTAAVRQLDSREETDHICLLDHGNMEVFLCMEGFGEIYKRNISEQKRRDITAKRRTLEYWQQVASAQKKNSKPKNSLAVAEKIVGAGRSGVPTLLQEVVERARELARSAG